jgi:hypothetical protein
MQDSAFQAEIMDMIEVDGGGSKDWLFLYFQMWSLVDIPFVYQPVGILYM